MCSPDLSLETTNQIVPTVKDTALQFKGNYSNSKKSLATLGMFFFTTYQGHMNAKHEKVNNIFSNFY